MGLQVYSDDHPVGHTVEVGAPDTRYAIVERGQNGWQCAHIAVPYDYNAMAQLAGLRGRPDWEHALRTGYMPRRDRANGQV